MYSIRLSRQIENLYPFFLRILRLELSIVIDFQKELVCADTFAGTIYRII